MHSPSKRVRAPPAAPRERAVAPRELPLALGWPCEEVAAWLACVDLEHAAESLRRLVGPAELQRRVALVGQATYPPRCVAVGPKELQLMAVKQLECCRALQLGADRTAIVLLAATVAL